MNGGFAFQDFGTRSDALEACKHLQKRDVLVGTDWPAKFAFSDTYIEMDTACVPCYNDYWKIIIGEDTRTLWSDKRQVTAKGSMINKTRCLWSLGTVPWFGAF